VDDRFCGISLASRLQIEFNHLHGMRRAKPQAGINANIKGECT
jgi:hypothetical protein